MGEICRAGLSFVDTFPSSKKNETVNLKMKLTAQVFIAMKSLHKLTHFLQSIMFSGLKRCQLTRDLL